ncbi:calmodulin-binding family protein [Trema orientale]|uniref:Calmodulin-binding family protein n=1 Tax=Trema orientale TaxID=63057 RepID=A0A2P5FJX8_TREOI|nr:calmodulin-binding family protein [Trema orientale]
MGVSFSCPFAEYNDVETGLESVIVKSISFGDERVKTPVRSVSFNRTDLEPMVLKSLGSGKMTVETSVSFKGRDLEKMGLGKVPSFDKEKDMAIESINSNRKQIDTQNSTLDSPLELVQPSISDPSSAKHMAAVKLQKVYKSFRTRRKLADCAVLVEQSWWKLLDFAELKRSSISYFDIEKHETAISRWSRARTRAAKVGKGLSKNDKAQKLALQHWLEAIDPRHRYGHNLHFYYDKWLHCQSREPFFYWLDIGEGKEINLDKCPRSKLQQQCIKYLGPMERMAYEVVLVDGKFFYKQSGELLHTTSEGKDAKWIFVLSTSKILYVGKKKKGTFQHSSFLAGGATTAAGRLVVENGILKAVWPHSGHYRPTEQNFKDFVSFLQENNVDLKDVQMSPVDEEDDPLTKQRSSLHMRNNSSDEDMTPLDGLETEEVEETEETNTKDLAQPKTDSTGQEIAAALEPHKSNRFLNLSKKLTNLEIPKREEIFERLESENQAAGLSRSSFHLESPVDDRVTAEEAFSSDQDYLIPKNLFDHDDEENEVEIIPEESILKRINSRKGMNSYQLGKQLSCKWTTGAGPRIGCVRDYPSELQFRALEKVNLSPRSVARSRSYFSPQTISGLSPKVSTSTNCSGEMAANSSSRISHHSRANSSPLIRKT